MVGPSLFGYGHHRRRRRLRFYFIKAWPSLRNGFKIPLMEMCFEYRRLCHRVYDLAYTYLIYRTQILHCFGLYFAPHGRAPIKKRISKGELKNERVAGHCQIPPRFFELAKPKRNILLTYFPS